jgi:hypothetical protein
MVAGTAGVMLSYSGKLGKIVSCLFWRFAASPTAIQAQYARGNMLGVLLAAVVLTLLSLPHHKTVASYGKAFFTSLLQTYIRVSLLLTTLRQDTTQTLDSNDHTFPRGLTTSFPAGKQLPLKWTPAVQIAQALYVMSMMLVGLEKC